MAEDNEELFPNWTDKVFNVTRVVSGDLALAYGSCAYMALDSYTWGETYIARFNDTEKYYSYPVSVLQSMLGSIFYLTELNVDLQKATEAEDTMLFNYKLGAIMRLILIVEPLAVDSLENEFDDDLSDFNAQTLKEKVKLKQSSPEYVPAATITPFYVGLYLVEGFFA